MSIFTLGATWINALLNTIWLSICKVIFVFINWLYQVFETVANVNLFSEEVFSDITSRIYIVMGIAMLFIFAYNLVLMIINPDDKKSTGSTTKLVKETIISLIVIVLLPTIFNYMYVFQGHVLSTNIIGQIIMGGIGSTSGDDSNCDPDDYECSCDFSQFEEIKKYGTGQDKNIFAEGFTEGNKDVYSNLVDACKSYKNDLTDSQRGAYSIAPTIFSAFYRPATYDMLDCEEYLKTGSSTLIDTDQKKQVCANFFYDIKMSKYTGNINAFVSDSYLNLTMSTDEGLIEFDWLFAIVAGGLAVWMFLCYAMEIGVRVAKLGVLQIISPIAVMMRVVPSKGGGQNQMFTKWFDELKNTYLDVFIRLVIIYFSLFAISLVPDVIATLFSSVYSGESNWFLQTLSLVIVILGILKFAQEAPELIKTFFGNSGRFALRSPGKQLADNKYAMGAMGAVGGAVSTAIKNRGRGLGSVIAGAGSGLFRGARAGAQSKDFKGLRYNTSAAVDRAIKARDERDARKKYDEEHGYMAYRRKQLGDSWERFTSSDSYASLSSKKKTIGDVSSAFNKAFDMAESKLEENATLFFVKDANGQFYSYDQYMRRSERAQEEYKTFDRQRYEELYGREAADKRLDDLLKAQTEAANTLKDVKEQLVNGMLKHNGQKFEDTLNGLEIRSEKMIDGLEANINEARNLLDQHSTLLSDKTKAKISENDTVRAVRGALKGELSDIGAEIAKLSELQNSGKK